MANWKSECNKRVDIIIGGVEESTASEHKLDGGRNPNFMKT